MEHPMPREAKKEPVLVDTAAAALKSGELRRRN
jgi:hypothetical protein